MGINAAMEIGKNGLNVFRTATAVVSQNIANVSTPGYSRQRAIIETAPTTNLSGYSLGTGSMISNVDRFYDGLLRQQIASTETTLGYDSTKSTVLQQIEPAFNEINTKGVGAALSNFFAAWQDLTNNPGGTSERQSVLSNAQILADDLHATSKILSDTVSLQNDSLTPMIDNINATLKDIARLNGQITSTDLVAGNANEVRDKRDLLLKELAKQIDVTTTENSDGTTDVKIPDGSGGTLALVTGATAGTFSLDKTNPDRFVVQLTSVGGTVTTVAPTTGSLGATLALRDSIIPGYQAQLGALATALTSEVNRQHIAGFDLSGVQGKDFFSPIPRTGDLSTGSDTVQNVDVTGLRIGMKVTGTDIPVGTIIGTIDQTNKTFTLIDSTTGLPAAATGTATGSTLTFPEVSAAALFSINSSMTTNTIAASSKASAAGDNINAVKIAGLQSQRLMSGNPPTLTFNGFWDGLVSEVGLNVASSKTNVSQDEAFSNQLNILRDTTSGVSLDQELSDLMMYQRSYQACAQIITTATAMMDTVLGIIR